MARSKKDVLEPCTGCSNPTFHKVDGKPLCHVCLFKRQDEAKAGAP